jgi:hypothetical protein
MLGLGNNLKKSGLITPGIITDSLVLKHKYDAGSVVPVSDGAAYFDDNNDNIQFSDITVDTNGNSAIVFWAKRYAVSVNDTVLGDTSHSHESQIRFESDGTMDFESNTNGDTATITLNNANDYDWHHYAFICTSGTLTAYQDGVSCSIANAGMSDDMTLNVMGGDGADGHGSNYGGYLCNVGIWTGTLTQAQIKSIMNKNYAGLSDSEKTNLVSWWNLDSYIIDASLTDLEAPTGSEYVYDNHNTSLGSELFANTNMDSGISPWGDYSTGTTSHETSITYSGTGALRTTNDGAGNTWLGQYGDSASYMTLEAGGTYLATAKVYIPSGWDGGKVYFTDGATFGSGNESVVRADNSLTNQWQDTKMIFTVVTDTTGTIFLRCSANPSADKYVIWDNFSCKKIGGNPGNLL